MAKWRRWMVPVFFSAFLVTGAASGEKPEQADMKAKEAKAVASETVASEPKAKDAKKAKAPEKVAAVEQPAEVEDPEDKMFCRTVKRVGSHRRVRVCRTAEEIREEAWEAEQYRESAFPAATPIDPGLGDGG